MSKGEIENEYFSTYEVTKENLDFDSSNEFLNASTCYMDFENKKGSVEEIDYNDITLCNKTNKNKLIKFSEEHRKAINDDFEKYCMFNPLTDDKNRYLNSSFIPKLLTKQKRKNIDTKVSQENMKFSKNKNLSVRFPDSYEDTIRLKNEVKNILQKELFLENNDLCSILINPIKFLMEKIEVMYVERFKHILKQKIINLIQSENTLALKEKETNSISKLINGFSSSDHQKNLSNSKIMENYTSQTIKNLIDDIINSNKSDVEIDFIIKKDNKEENKDIYEKSKSLFSQEELNLNYNDKCNIYSENINSAETKAETVINSTHTIKRYRDYRNISYNDINNKVITRTDPLYDDYVKFNMYKKKIMAYAKMSLENALNVSQRKDYISCKRHYSKLLKDLKFGKKKVNNFKMCCFTDREIKLNTGLNTINSDSNKEMNNDKTVFEIEKRQENTEVLSQLSNKNNIKCELDQQTNVNQKDNSITNIKDYDLSNTNTNIDVVKIVNMKVDEINDIVDKNSDKKKLVNFFSFKPRVKDVSAKDDGVDNSLYNPQHTLPIINNNKSIFKSCIMSSSINKDDQDKDLMVLNANTKDFIIKETKPKKRIFVTKKVINDINDEDDDSKEIDFSIVKVTNSDSCFNKLEDVDKKCKNYLSIYQEKDLPLDSLRLIPSPFVINRLLTKISLINSCNKIEFQTEILLEGIKNKNEENVKINNSICIIIQDKSIEQEIKKINDIDLFVVDCNLINYVTSFSYVHFEFDGEIDNCEISSFIEEFNQINILNNKKYGIGCNSKSVSMDFGKKFKAYEICRKNEFYGSSIDSDLITPMASLKKITYKSSLAFYRCRNFERNMKSEHAFTCGIVLKPIVDLLPEDLKKEFMCFIKNYHSFEIRRFVYENNPINILKQFALFYSTYKNFFSFREKTYLTMLIEIKKFITKIEPEISNNENYTTPFYKLRESNHTFEKWKEFRSLWDFKDYDAETCYGKMDKIYYGASAFTDETFEKKGLAFNSLISQIMSI